MIATNLFSRRYRQLLQHEPGLITRARIRILAISILGFAAVYMILLALYIVEGRDLLLLRIVLLLISLSFALLALMKFPWRISAHLLIATITAVVWTNTLFFSNGVNATTVQYTILALSLGYYLLGANWGRCYAVLNILPVIVVAIVENYAKGAIAPPQLQFSIHSYPIVLVFNYLLLMYIHYIFFSTYRNVQQQESLLKENLQQAAITAQELAQTKTNFLSTMSHELRTPLHAVIGMANLLLTNGSEKDRQENLDILRFSAQSLMSTVNDILDFSKIEKEDLVLENNRFSPTELVSNIYGAFRPTANEKGIELHYQEDPKVKKLFLIGDDTRLSQILFNLIGNAIKFTASGKVTISLSTKYIDLNNVTLNFQIADTGIGIPTEHLTTIFDPFVQISARTDNRSRGTGLGLTIAYKLVKMQGGELDLQSETGKGTTFSFSINYLTAVDSPIKVGQPTLGASLEYLKVLIVEDEIVNVMVLTKILERWDITPDVRVNGAEAIQAVSDNEYDVVLMDINMPIMDGFEASKKIRRLSDKKKAAIPIIAITASVGAAAEQVRANHAIDDCLLKPFKIEHLREKLEIIVKQQKDNSPRMIIDDSFAHRS